MGRDKRCVRLEKDVVEVLLRPLPAGGSARDTPPSGMRVMISLELVIIAARMVSVSLTIACSSNFLTSFAKVTGLLRSLVFALALAVFAVDALCCCVKSSGESKDSTRLTRVSIVPQAQMPAFGVPDVLALLKFSCSCAAPPKQCRPAADPWSLSISVPHWGTRAPPGGVTMLLKIFNLLIIAQIQERSQAKIAGDLGGGAPWQTKLVLCFSLSLKLKFL